VFTVDKKTGNTGERGIRSDLWPSAKRTDKGNEGEEITLEYFGFPHCSVSLAAFLRLQPLILIKQLINII